jgi:hypothetical protein
MGLVQDVVFYIPAISIRCESGKNSGKELFSGLSEMGSGQMISFMIVSSNKIRTLSTRLIPGKKQLMPGGPLSRFTNGSKSGLVGRLCRDFAARFAVGRWITA